MVNYEAVLKELYGAIDNLYTESSDFYRVWARSVAQRELSRKNNAVKHSEKTGYELRVEMKGVGFNVYWYEVRFVRAGRQGKLVRLAKMISVGANGFYGKEKFKNASEWELALIMNAEDQLGRIRNQLKNLVKAHTSILYAAKASGASIKGTPIKVRVEPINVTVSSIKKQLS